MAPSVPDLRPVGPELGLPHLGHSSAAGAGLPVSPDRRERRESSSASPAAFACPGPEGGAAGRGVSGVFRRPSLPMGRRADGGVASPLPFPGTRPAGAIRGVCAPGRLRPPGQVSPKR